MGWSTWNRLIEGLKVFLPPRLDRSYFDSLGFSGSQYSQALRALSFLGLMTKAKRPTERLRLLVAAGDDERQQVLREILENAYRPFFDNPGPEKATVGALEDYMRSTGAKGVVDKCVTFFLSAAKEAQIPLSPQLAGESGRRIGRGLKAPRKAKSRTSSKAGLAEGVSAGLAQSLVGKFAGFDPNWSDDLCQRWFEAFQELLQRIK